MKKEFLFESEYAALTPTRRLKYKKGDQCYNSMLKEWHECGPEDWACNVRTVYVKIK